jgi:hypothetical protein
MTNSLYLTTPRSQLSHTQRRSVRQSLPAQTAFYTRQVSNFMNITRPSSPLPLFYSPGAHYATGYTAPQHVFFTIAAVPTAVDGCLAASYVPPLWSHIHDTLFDPFLLRTHTSASVILNLLSHKPSCASRRNRQLQIISRCLQQFHVCSTYLFRAPNPRRQARTDRVAEIPAARRSGRSAKLEATNQIQS